MIDRIKYEVFYWMWKTWHTDLRRTYDRIAAKRGKAKYERARRTIEGIVPKFYQVDSEHRSEWEWECMRIIPFDERWFWHYTRTRPWHHMCCNGDMGGWRTRVCDWLEHKWRATRYYSNEEWLK